MSLIGWIPLPLLEDILGNRCLRSMNPTIMNCMNIAEAMDQVEPEPEPNEPETPNGGAQVTTMYTLRSFFS